MLNESEVGGVAADIERWSSGRVKQVVLRLLRGEPVKKQLDDANHRIGEVADDASLSEVSAGTTAR
jgi:hypothetical protein